MKLLEMTRDSTPENLAIDEVLLEFAETSPHPVEVLRLWENPSMAVIVGRSSKIAEETNVAYCQEQGIEVFRRSSGGAAVVIGPGCLMFSLVLDTRRRPNLKLIDEAHRFVMEHLVCALQPIHEQVRFQGICDLTLNERKFSGNSLRCKRNAILYHGTILYDFPLETVTRCLATPPRQPDYRKGRDHASFVTNFPSDRSALSQALKQTLGASEPLVGWPEDQVGPLAINKYATRHWIAAR